MEQGNVSSDTINNFDTSPISISDTGNRGKGEVETRVGKEQEGEQLCYQTGRVRDAEVWLWNEEKKFQYFQ